jgi:hypothetical protein
MTMLYNVFFIVETLINKLVRVWMCVCGVCVCVCVCVWVGGYVGGWVGGYVGGWVCGCDFFKNSLHNFELIRRT